MSRNNRIYNILIALGIVLIVNVKVANATTITFDDMSNLSSFILNDRTAVVHGVTDDDNGPPTPSTPSSTAMEKRSCD